MINTKYPTTKPSLNLDFANTKSLDPRITFRRGTPGTYYDGVTHVKAEENLLSYSEDFTDSSWEKREFLTPTGSQDDPQGGSSAFSFVPTTNNLSHLLFSNITAELGYSYTQSIFAKANGYSILRITLSTGFGSASNSDFVDFDLSGGLIVNNPNALNASISSAGGSWYRCSVSAVCDGYPSGSARGEDRFVFSVIDVSSNDGSYTFAGDGTSGIYIWGAQLEQRDSVTSYTATNGTPITKYQPKLMTASPDSARFDHDPITGESKGLLIEEQRTNLVLKSEDISHLIEQNVLIEHNTMLAPDGTITADKIVANASSVSHNRVYSSNYSLSNNQDYTLSFYAKRGEIHHVYASLWDSTGGTLPDSQIWFNLLTGEFNLTKGSSAFMEELSNGWYRCSVSSTNDASTNAHGIRIQLGDDSGGNPQSNFQGDGYSGLYIWGLQLETGSFPTSYIKTTGASATRSADNASITGENFSSWYRQDEGSIYAEIISAKNIENTNTGQCALSIGDGSTSNIFRLRRSTSDRTIGMIKRVNGSNTAIASSTESLADNTEGKLVGAYDLDNSYMAFNGSSVLSASGISPLNLNKAIIGDSPFTNGDCLNGHIKKLAYYPQRLTNEQLQNLTK